MMNSKFVKFEFKVMFRMYKNGHLDLCFERNKKLTYCAMSCDCEGIIFVRLKLDVSSRTLHQLLLCLVSIWTFGSRTHPPPPRF